MYIEEIKLIKTTKKDKDYTWLDIQSDIEKEYSKKNLNNILDALQDTFKENNIRYIWGSFSGGHDEGGFDDAQFFDKNDKEVEIKNLVAHWVTQYSVFKTDEKEEIKFYVSEHCKTIDILTPNNNCSPMSLLYATGALNEYGSFAGEYNVQGEVKLDLINKKYKRTGSQTVDAYENIDEEGSLV